MKEYTLFPEEQQRPEKVSAMLDAVIILLDQGMDINKLTVAEITKKAGIGKGTAYEYFKSKEALIVCALVDCARKQIAQLYLLEQEQERFKDKIYTVFDWIENNFSNNRSLVHLVKISTGSYEIAKTFHEECQKLTHYCQQYLQITDHILNSGVEEKEILPMKKITLGRMFLISQIMSYIMYVGNKEMQMEPIISEEVRHFIYQSILKALN